MSSLMEYIPEFPPLSLKTIRKDYFGKKAFDYDLNRGDSDKWKREIVDIIDGRLYSGGDCLGIELATDVGDEAAGVKIEMNLTKTHDCL